MSRAAPDLGDLIVVLLAGNLAGIRDRLAEDGFEDASEFVADLVEAIDHYISAAFDGGLSVAAVGNRASMAAIEPERPNQCPSCGEAVVEKRITCPNCGYEYEEGDYTMSPEELGERTPDEFQTEVSEEKLEAVTEEGEEA